MPHYERARVIAVTQPQYAPEPVNKKCVELLDRKVTKAENPYEKIIAREVRNWFDQSRLTAIFDLNSITQEELFKIRVAFHQKGMSLKSYGRSIMQKALGGTKYEATLPLYNGKFCLVFGPEETCLKEVLRITKKVPQMILLAGVLENRIMSRTEMTKYVALPDIQIARSQLCNVLQMAAGGLVSNLEAHQKQLVQILDVHANESKPKPE